MTVQVYERLVRGTSIAILISNTSGNKTESTDEGRTGFLYSYLIGQCIDRSDGFSCGRA